MILNDPSFYCSVRNKEEIKLDIITLLLRAFFLVETIKKSLKVLLSNCTFFIKLCFLENEKSACKNIDEFIGVL